MVMMNMLAAGEVYSLICG